MSMLVYSFQVQKMMAIRKNGKLEEKMRKTISNEFCNDEMYKKYFRKNTL